MNTHPLILKDAFGTHYLRLFDGWMTAAAVTGPWSVARTVLCILVKGEVKDPHADGLVAGVTKLGGAQ